MAEFLMGTGIWVVQPSRLTQPFPYLRLLQSLPERPGLPAYQFAVALATNLEAVEENIEQEDRYLEAADELVYQLTPKRLRLKTSPPRLAVKMPSRIDPLVLEPVLMAALSAAGKEVGVQWEADSLQQAERNNRFTTLETAEPIGEVGLEFDGTTYRVQAGDFVAAGLRLALAETARIADYRPFTEGFGNPR